MAELELSREITGAEKTPIVDQTTAVEVNGALAITKMQEFVARETDSIKDVYGDTTDRSKFLNAEQMLSTCLTQRRNGNDWSVLQELQAEAYRILDELNDDRSRDIKAFYQENLEKLEQLRKNKESPSK